MAITDEQLQRYWEANPQELERAVASNPGMFGLSSQQDFNVGMPSTASQRPEPVGSGMMSGITNQQLENYWRQNPQALQSAIQQDPMAFLSQGLQDVYGGYQQRVSDVENQSTLQGVLASEDFGYVPGGRVQGVLTGGAYLPEQMQLGQQRSQQMLENSGLPKYQVIDGNRVYLNTGFTYTDGDYIVSPAADAPVGSYSVVGQRRDGVGPAGLLPIIGAALGGPLGAAVGSTLGGGGSGGIPEGGSLFDAVGGVLSLGKNISDLNRPRPGEGETYNPEVETRDEVLEGVGGLLDDKLESFEDWIRRQDTEYPAWSWKPPPPPRVPDDVVEDPTTTTEGGGGGGGGGGTPSQEDKARPTDPTESPVVLGEYIGNGEMVLSDGRVVDAPEGPWEVGDPVYEHSPEKVEEVDETLIDWGAIFSSIFDNATTGDGITDPTTTTGTEGTGEGGGTGDGVGEGEGAGEGDGEGDGIGDGIGSGTGVGDGTGTGGGSGSGRGTGTGSGEGPPGGKKRGLLPLGMLSSNQQAKDFMANIEYIVPLLQQMNIPLEDFLAMWMNRE
jgi:hypothetical protein